MKESTHSIDERKAQQKFEDAAALLNGYNLADVFGVCCQLSCLDFFSSIDRTNELFFSVLNFEKISMFSKAILASNSREYKLERFQSSIVPKLFNLLVDATYFDALTDENISPEQKLLKFFAKIANAQFRFQRLNIRSDLARAYILYDVLPKEHQKSLQRKHGSNYVDIPCQFNILHGISIREYLVVAFRLFSFYLMQYKRFLATDPKEMAQLQSELTKYSNPNQELIRKLMSLVDNSIQVRHEFIFKS